VQCRAELNSSESEIWPVTRYITTYRKRNRQLYHNLKIESKQSTLLFRCGLLDYETNQQIQDYSMCKKYSKCSFNVFVTFW
jgi:hypothetical protein